MLRREYGIYPKNSKTFALYHTCNIISTAQMCYLSIFLNTDQYCWMIRKQGRGTRKAEFCCVRKTNFPKQLAYMCGLTRLNVKQCGTRSSWYYISQRIYTVCSNMFYELENNNSSSLRVYLMAGTLYWGKIFVHINVDIWAAMSGNVPSDMCAQRRFRSDSSFAQSDQNLH